MGRFFMLCQQLFNAEPTGEAKRLYEIFKVQGQERVDVREFMLGLNNFVAAEKSQRVQFAFHLFDVDRSGDIDEMELVRILKANHLVSDEKAVCVLPAAAVVSVVTSLLFLRVCCVDFDGPGI